MYIFLQNLIAHLPKMELTLSESTSSITYGFYELGNYETTSLWCYIQQVSHFGLVCDLYETKWPNTHKYWTFNNRFYIFIWLVSNYIGLIFTVCRIMELQYNTYYSDLCVPANITQLGSRYYELRSPRRATWGCKDFFILADFNSYIWFFCTWWKWCQVSE